ncbi:MAG: ATP-binding protein [Verrucomicrobiae bacterium]
MTASAPDPHQSSGNPGTFSLNESDEIEITAHPELTAEQAILIDFHSVINMIGVLHECLELLQAEKVAGLESAKARVFRLSEEIKSAAAHGRQFELARTFSVFLAAEIETVIRSSPAPGESPEVAGIRETIFSVLEVFQVRMAELHDRFSNPRAWVSFTAGKLSASIGQVLSAIEKNARGRYRIVRNIAEQTPRDYQVHLDISSAGGGEFFMPPVLHDVFRDLIANAIKYTLAGGKIIAGLHASEKGVRLVIEDNGLGIPREEMRKVVEFGYRASNVLKRRTLGGGFGLTKAFWTAKSFSGRMWVRSRVGAGTRVTLFIPAQSHRA